MAASSAVTERRAVAETIGDGAAGDGTAEQSRPPVPGCEERQSAAPMLKSLAIVAKLEEAGLKADVARQVAELIEASQETAASRLVTFQTFDVRLLQHETYLREFTERVEQAIDIALTRGDWVNSGMLHRIQDSYVRTQVGLTDTRRKIFSIYATMDLSLSAMRRKVDRLIGAVWAVAILLAVIVAVQLFGLYKAYYEGRFVAEAAMALPNDGSAAALDRCGAGPNAKRPCQG